MQELKMLDVEQGLMNLTSFGFQQGSTTYVMARAVRGRGCGKRGPTPWTNKGSSMSESRKGRKLVEHLIVEVSMTYRDGIDARLQKLIEDWEV